MIFYICDIFYSNSNLWELRRCNTVRRAGLKIWPSCDPVRVHGGLWSLSYRVSRKRSEHHSSEAFVERADALLTNQLSQDVPEAVGIFALRSCGSNTNTHQTFCRRSRWRTWQRLTHRSGNETSARREESPRPSWRSLPSRRQTECWERWAPSGWRQRQVYYTQSRSSCTKLHIWILISSGHVTRLTSCPPAWASTSATRTSWSTFHWPAHLRESDSCQSCDIRASHHVFIYPWTAHEPINILQ